MPSTTPQYDVVVVGARCAGASTAMLLARAGHRVLLVDRTELPADTLSTHALLLGGMVQLSRWGLLDAVAATGATPVRAVQMRIGDGGFTGLVKPVAGVEALYAPRRHVLDGLLLDAARAAGAEVRTGVTIRDVLRDGSGRVVGVRGAQGDRAFSATAVWVVGADGVRSTIAERVAARTYRYAAPTNAVQYAYFTGVPTDSYEFAFGPRVGAGLIPTNDGTVCAYAAFPAQRWAAVRRDVDGQFAAVTAAASPDIAERLAGARRVTGYRGSRGLPGYLRRPFGPGWALVGDAGYHRDPFSAHGMTDAFRDAELLARALSAALTGAAPAQALAGYHATRDRIALPVYEATEALASYDWSTDELDELLAAFGEAGDREVELLTSLDDWPRRRASAA